MSNSNLKNKTLLVQGAGRGNLGIVKAAKENGVKIILTGLGGDYPCSPYADKECLADITDCQAILRVAQDNNIDGAIICCSDTGIQAVGKCNDALHLSGVTEASAVLSSNKADMKAALVAHGVRTAKHFEVRNLEEVFKAIHEISLPVIIKAVDLQGSRGIYIIRDTASVEDAFKQVMAQTKQNYCIVEKFLEGREFGAQAFVYNGDILFILPHGDETLMCETNVPVGHYIPLELTEEQEKDIESQVSRAIRALKFNNCAVNVDLIEVDGKSYVIELTGRVGANALPELVSNYFGINYYDMILYASLGESPLPIFHQQKKGKCATLARMIQSEKAGTVESIDVPFIPDTDILMFVKPGSEVRKFTNCNDAIGQIIVKGHDLAECEAKIQNALSKINLNFI